MWHGQQAFKVWLLDTFGESFNHSLDNVTWSAGLQGLTFGYLWWEFQSQPWQRDMGSRPSKFGFWWEFESKTWQRDMASRPSKFGFWWEFESKTWQRDMASRPSKFDVWWLFQSEPWRRDMVSCSQWRCGEGLMANECTEPWNLQVSATPLSSTASARPTKKHLLWREDFSSNWVFLFLIN